MQPETPKCERIQVISSIGVLTALAVAFAICYALAPMDSFGPWLMLALGVVYVAVLVYMKFVFTQVRREAGSMQLGFVGAAVP